MYSRCVQSGKKTQKPRDRRFGSREEGADENTQLCVSSGSGSGFGVCSAGSGASVGESGGSAEGDKALADQIRQTKPQPVLHNPTAMEKTSVVAEMTPYARTTRHPNWSFDKVKALQGQQVRVVGQLMADNDHFNAQDDCGFHGAAPGCWRSTVWEIHPILKLVRRVFAGQRVDGSGQSVDRQTEKKRGKT